MNEDENQGHGFLDITQYSEKTRKIIFGVIVAFLLVIVGCAMFIISPQNDKAVAEEFANDTAATQAAVSDESSPSPTAPPTLDPNMPNYDGNFPKDEQEAADLAQKKIIEKGLEERKEVEGREITDVHVEIPDAEAIQLLATKGMLEYCIDNPDETKEQKQERLKPYFHTDNADYQSPQSIFFLQKCSLGDATEAYYDENQKIVVHVGVAWAAQFEENGNANTGYTQYNVIVDKDGIVSFHD